MRRVLRGPPTCLSTGRNKKEVCVDTYEDARANGVKGIEVAAMNGNVCALYYMLQFVDYVAGEEQANKLVKYNKLNSIKVLHHFEAMPKVRWPADFRVDRKRGPLYEFLRQNDLIERRPKRVRAITGDNACMKCPDWPCGQWSDCMRPNKHRPGW